MRPATCSFVLALGCATGAAACRALDWDEFLRDWWLNPMTGESVPRDEPAPTEPGPAGTKGGERCSGSD